MKDLASADTCSGYWTSTRHIRDCTTIVRSSSVAAYLYHPGPLIQMAPGHIRARKSILPAPKMSSDHMKHSPMHRPLVRMVGPVSFRATHMTKSLLLYAVFRQLHEILIDLPLLGRVDTPAEISNLDLPLHS